jgi:hypothetical protein
MLEAADAARYAGILAPWHDVVPVRSFRELRARMETSPFAAAFVNPIADHRTPPTTELARLSNFVAERPQYPFCVVASRHAAASCRALLLQVHVRILWRGVDDSSTDLLEVAASLERRLVTQRLKLGLRRALAMLGPEVGASIDRVLDAPQDWRTAARLADSMQISRRSLFYRLRDAGLAPPHAFVVAARVGRAFHMIGCQKSSLKSAAVHLGDASDRALRRQVWKVLGVPPHGLARVGSAEVVRRLVLFLRHGVAPEVVQPQSARPWADTPTDGANPYESTTIEYMQ